MKFFRVFFPLIHSSVVYPLRRVVINFKKSKPLMDSFMPCSDDTEIFIRYYI